MRLFALSLGLSIALLTACSAPPEGTGGGGGSLGGGAGGGAGGAGGGSMDAGLDAGCGGPAQLAFTSAAQTLVKGSCSTAVKLQLQDACGAAVTAPADLPIAFSSSSVTFQLFTESQCIATRPQWSLTAGTSELELYVKDSESGTPTLSASASGLDGGQQTFTIGCPATQRECQGECIPRAACCENRDCTDGGLPWICATDHVCEPPICVGFPANCGFNDYVDRTAVGANRTVTFDTLGGYQPKCMRVSTSQDVTFSGPFNNHPLQQTCGPSNRNMSTNSGFTKTIRFADFGTYGYRCAAHPSFEQGSIKTP